MGGAGFEPAKAEPADLQSAPFDRFGNPPVNQTGRIKLRPSNIGLPQTRLLGLPYRLLLLVS